MNSVLLWIGGLLIAALSLLFAVPAVVDWNSYRGVFEEEASRLLGRDVRVGGKVNLRLLPAPYVRFEKVRISDADAKLGESFFRAESFTLWLSAVPLLRGAIEANEIELDRPVLRLAVDADGTGNWQTLRRVRGSLPFVPSDVVLQQIRIRGGTVSLKTPERAEPVELTGIDGELSATTLAGPYRFRGNVGWGGVGREVRAAVAPQDDDGRLRFKVNVRVPESNNTYTFDGGLSELTTRARLEGALTARLPIPSAAASAPGSATGAASGATAGSRPRAGDQNAFDFQAAVLGDIDGVKLSDIGVAFEQDGKPQLISGAASASWRGAQRVEAQLSSRWLDLDRISGTGAVRPLDAIREMIERIGAMLPEDGTTFATLDVDQVNLGGEALSGVRLALARVAGRTSIGELKAGLPGNAKASVRGILGAGGDPKAFEGEIVLRGASYQRFSTWAAKSAAAKSAAGTSGTGEAGEAEARPVPVKGDGAFSLASQLKMLPGRIALSGASVEFAGAQLQGDLEWSWGGQKDLRELRVSVDGTTIDVSAVAPGLLDLASWRDGRGAGTSTATATAGPTSPLSALGARARLVNAAVGNLRVKVRAQNLTDGAETLHDVDADLSFEPAGLAISSLKFVSRAGVAVDMQGEIKSLETKPAGRIRGWLLATGGPPVQALANAFATPDSPLQPGWAARVSRVDLGFDAVLGGTRPDQLSVRANGAIDDGRIQLALTLGGGLNGWRESPIDLTLQIDSPEMPNLVRRIVSGREPAPGIVGPDSASGNLVMKAVGASAAALMSYAQLDSNGIGLTYNGTTKVTADGAVDVAGDIGVVSADVADLLTLVGVARRPQLPGIGVEGAVTVMHSGGKAHLESRSLMVGSSRVAGRLDLRRDADRLSVDGELSASQVSVPALLGLVLDGRQTAANDAAAMPGEAGSPWPETAFALGALDNIAGRIALTTPSLQLSSDLAVDTAELAFDIEPGRVTLSKLTGGALGGQLNARSVIERTPSGVGANVRFEGQLSGAHLGMLVAVAGTDPPDLGQANIALKLEGRGLGPRAVLSVVSGTGEAEIANARVRGLGPTAVNKTAQALIEGQEDITRALLERVVRRALAGSVLSLAPVKLPIEIADGTMKIAALQLDTPDARVRNQTTVDLGSLKLDSEWQIAPRRPLPVRQGTVAKAPLPPVTLVWSGPLTRLSALEPRLSVEALEREITVRKIERDVERLEALRRQDEEHARQEADRLKRLDDQAQGPGAGASTPPPVIQAPFNIPAPQQVPRPVPGLVPRPVPVPSPPGASGGG